MQTVGGAVVADIGGDAAGTQPVVERVAIGALMDKAAIERGREKGGAGCGHGAVI